MDKLLKIYTYVDGVNDTPFPNAGAQIEIFSFNYNAKRMGGAPTISTSVMYKDCLDKLWTGKEYVIYNGERYKLKQTPTSSKSNTDARYKHELELVSLRVVLDYVYFFDAVADNTPVDDKPVTNSTKVAFSGDIHEFAKRLNASLEYTKLEYRVVVDKDITSETKFLSFSDQPISSVLQEIYKQYEIPYYFLGNEIHIGYMSNAITTAFEYGANNALLSISKNNANNKIVNRCTGVGSSENIPYYYPNEHPIGEVYALYNNSSNNALSIVDEALYKDKVKLSSILKRTQIDDKVFYPSFKYYSFSTWYYAPFASGADAVEIHDFAKVLSTWFIEPFNIHKELLHANYGTYKHLNLLTHSFAFSMHDYAYCIQCELPVSYAGKKYNVTCEIENSDKYRFDIEYYNILPPKEILRPNGFYERVEPPTSEKTDFIIKPKSEYSYCEPLYVMISFTEAFNNPEYWYNNSIVSKIYLRFELEDSIGSENWQNENDSIVELSDYGLAYNGTPAVGDKITFRQVEGSLIPSQDALMPTIYRKSKGAESFYNAINYPFAYVSDYVLNEDAGEYVKDGCVHNDNYIDPATGLYYVFVNEYTDESRHEHKETFEYIKPSIENVTNAKGNPINMFLEFAYDETDNDEIDEKGEYVHPYFFAKLRKFDGEFGFNLFTSASEQGEMTFSMTIGNCGACQFVVGVDSETKKNIVQVDEYGNLKRDKNGNVVRIGEAQDVQNDTVNNEVWIALKKDANTYPDIMPNITYNYKPKACTKTNGVYNNDGDTFVILNINMPSAYKDAAEALLVKEIVKYMLLNNSEKFNFSIKFSRIYLAENPKILADLNENARIQIKYNNDYYELYVSSFQYKVSNSEALPEITVELAESLSTNENAIQQAISAVEHSIMSSVGSIDFYAQGLRYFIRKDVEDYARGLIHFTKGAKFGINDIASIDENGYAELANLIIKEGVSSSLFMDGFAGQGYRIWINEDGKACLTIDELTVRGGFRVFEYIATKLRAVNGGLFISAANGKVKRVEESEDGNSFLITLEETSQFEAGDYVRCQVLNVFDLMSYWVEVAESYGSTIRVLKSEFNDTIPMAGHDLVLCGSRNKNRQNAIHISATDDGQPRIDILSNISSKSLDGCLRTRLGNLDGITDNSFGDKQPHGDGLYSDNAYLKGEFILANRGESVDTLFSIQEGKLQSSIAQTQAEAIKGKTLLYNASFTKGLDGWQTSNEEGIYYSDDSILFSDNDAWKNSVKVYSEPIFDDIFCVNIDNGWIKQYDWQFVDKPSFEENGEYPIHFSANVRCRKEGNLVVKVGNVTLYEAVIEPSADFFVIDTETKWNGTGDFELSFDGNADFYGLTIYTEKTEVRHVTLFEQTDRIISATAALYGENNELLLQSGLVIKPESAGIFTKDKNGNVATIGTYEDGVILLSGNEIRLQGDVSLNGKVRIDAETGTLFAEDGEFAGKVTAEQGNIGGFEIKTNYIESTSENTSMSLSSQYIYFQKDHTYGLSTANFGNNTISSISGNYNCPLKIDVEGKNAPFSNLGLYISVFGANKTDASLISGNHALYIPKGDICGFRLRTRRVAAGTVLDKMDSVVILDSGNIILPSDSEEGHILIIRSQGAFAISATGNDLIYTGYGVSQVYSTDVPASIILYYDKANQLWFGGGLSPLV